MKGYFVSFLTQVGATVTTVAEVGHPLDYLLPVDCFGSHQGSLLGKEESGVTCTLPVFLNGFKEVEIDSRGTGTAGKVGRSLSAVAPYTESHVGF